MGLANENPTKTPASGIGKRATQETKRKKSRLDTIATADPLENCSRPKPSTTNCAAARMFPVRAARTLAKELPSRTTGVPTGRRTKMTAGS